MDTLYQVLLSLAIGIVVYIITDIYIRSCLNETPLQRLSGRAKQIRAVSRRTVQFYLDNAPHLIELYTNDAWVIYPGDQVDVVGYKDSNGKFIGLGYINQTRGISNYQEPRIPGDGSDMILSIIVNIFSFLAVFHSLTFIATIVLLILYFIFLKISSEDRQCKHVISLMFDEDY